MVLLVTAAVLVVTMLALTAGSASAQACEGYIYDGRRLGAIGALTAEDIAARPYEQRCLIGSARDQAGDLPPAPEGYVWNSDYTLSPSGGYWYYDYDYQDWYYWYP
jgi:hypothetical protein